MKAKGQSSLHDLQDLSKLIFHRIAKLEMLDEVEELDLVLSHYAVSFGTNSDAMQGIHL